HGHQLGSPTALGLVAEYPGFDVIVYGHTHRAGVERVEGVLVANPGAAGRSRFGLGPSVAVVTLSTAGAEGSVLPLCTEPRGTLRPRRPCRSRQTALVLPTS